MGSGTVKKQHCLVEIPSHWSSDGLYMDLPTDLKSWLDLDSDDILRSRKALYELKNALVRWHPCFSRALHQVVFVSVQMDPCIWVLLSSLCVSLDDPCDVPSELVRVNITCHKRVIVFVHQGALH